MKKIFGIILVILAICTVMTFNVAAEEANFTVTETLGKGSMRIISLEDEDAYCVQMNVRRPSKDTEYVLTDYNIDGINSIYIAMHLINDGSYDFRVASQVAIWSFVEGMDYGDTVYQFVGASDEARAFYDKIMETSKTVNVSKYNVKTNYYAADGFQVLATVTVKEIPPVMAPAPVIPEPTPEPTPEPEKPVIPETEPEITPEPEVEPEIIPDPVPETVVTPDPIPEEPTPEPEIVPEPEVLADEPYYPEAPQTGDNSNILLWVILMAVSLTTLVILVATRKKHAKEN